MATKKTIILDRQAVLAAMHKCTPPFLGQQQLADAAGLDLRSISSAINQHNVTALVASRIANALLGSQDFSSLVKEASGQHEATFRVKHAFEREIVEHIVADWYENGQKASPRDPRLPMHPELIYRAMGDWRGWSHFLSVDASSSPDDYAMNAERDRLESIAFKEFEDRYIQNPNR